MKTSGFSILAFFFILALGIYASPTNNILEITAQLCHLSEPKEKCFCSEEMEDIISFLAPGEKNP